MKVLDLHKRVYLFVVYIYTRFQKTQKLLLLLLLTDGLLYCSYFFWQISIMKVVIVFLFVLSRTENKLDISNTSRLPFN